MTHETKLAIRLPKHLKEQLTAIAKSRFISVADVAREAMLEMAAKQTPKTKETKP